MLESAVDDNRAQQRCPVPALPNPEDTLPPVEPIVLAPRKYHDRDDESGVVAPRSRHGRRPMTSAAQSFGVRKYAMMASMSLKDVGEIDHKHAKPIDILRAHSVGSTQGVDVFNSLLAYVRRADTSPTNPRRRRGRDADSPWRRAAPRPRRDRRAPQVRGGPRVDGQAVDFGVFAPAGDARARPVSLSARVEAGNAALRLVVFF